MKQRKSMYSKAEVLGIMKHLETRTVESKILGSLLLFLLIKLVSFRKDSGHSKFVELVIRRKSLPYDKLSCQLESQ